MLPPKLAASQLAALEGSPQGSFGLREVVAERTAGGFLVAEVVDVVRIWHDELAKQP
jgi:hypothetical protein